MKVLILVAIFACVRASEDIVDIASAQHEAAVQEAQFPMSPMMNPMMMMGGMGGMGMGGMPMGGMGGMGGMPMSGMGGMPMSGMGEGYQTNYNLPCSNSCGCARMCVPMMPCNCVCPPRCPPQQSTEPPTLVSPVCVNGAPDWTYPHCCYNGGQGEFCCLNGANNLHCCENGANNPWCSPVTAPPPVLVTDPPSNPGNDCNQCRCQPCIPWVPCQPCPCQQRCGGFGK